MGRLLLHLLHEPGALDDVGEARVVLDVGRDGELSARLHALDQDRIEHGAGGIDRRRVAGRAGADNHKLGVGGIAHRLIRPLGGKPQALPRKPLWFGWLAPDARMPKARFKPSFTSQCRPSRGYVGIPASYATGAMRLGEIIHIVGRPRGRFGTEKAPAAVPAGACISAGLGQWPIFTRATASRGPASSADDGAAYR